MEILSGVVASKFNVILVLRHIHRQNSVFCCVRFQIAQLDEVKIRISALRAVIDLLLLFGFQLLSESASTQAANPIPSPEKQEDDAALAEDKGDVPEDTAQSILVMLSEFLDSEVGFSLNA